MELAGGSTLWVIAFDIGGTSSRSGVVDPEGNLIISRKVPSTSFLTAPEMTSEELQGTMIRFLVTEARELLSILPIDSPTVAAISMGAALNGHNGFIYNNGPLWGTKSQPLDLIEELSQIEPSIDWVVCNDVTASLLRNVEVLDARERGRTTLITVSTGIAARIFDHANSSVPLDMTYGLQGEIGHLPVHVFFRDAKLHSQCDCGGADHLNAFSSGRGMMSTLRNLGASHSEELKDSPLADLSEDPLNSMRRFEEALRSRHSFAMESLRSFISPLAEIIVGLLTWDAEVDRVLLVGGVIRLLGDTYLSLLWEVLDEIGLYQILEREPDYFRSRINIGLMDDYSGLLGAARYARLRLDTNHG